MINSQCLDCHHITPYAPTLLSCPSCHSEWLEASYDLPKIAVELPGALKQRPFDLWRYRELLPVLNFNPNLSIGEGGTPMIRAHNLGMMIGLPNLFIKDERQGPTGSFKDRQAAVNIAALKEAGITEVVLASTGNVAISYSAYAARAGIKLWAFLTSLVPAEKMREVALYGTQVVKVTASYDQAKKVAAEFARQRNLYLERGSRSIPSVEAMKTIAFEIVEQLTALSDQTHAVKRTDPREKRVLSTRPLWIAPDWYFQSVSGGLGPLGVQKGFYELYQMGWIDHLPAIACIQTAGCAPMVKAWQENLDSAEPVKAPRTHIATLSTGDPGRTYTLLKQRMARSQSTGQGAELDGLFEAVSDEDTFRAMHILAKLEGLSVEPAAAVAFSGLIKLARAGVIKPEHTIVVNCTGHTMPVERIILGQGWARNVIIRSEPLATAPVARPQPASTLATPAKAEGARPESFSAPQEGLLSALNRVADDRYPNILIVDDTEAARRLIRRILQAQGNYRILEAANGRQAIETARKELPDLIILDLMMPEVDGFGVLDALKGNESTAEIPVIVVTAKELTIEEKQRLSGQISSLMQKGQFMSDELLEEVRDTLLADNPNSNQ
jgi:threonine synthase